jgi:hypothetical protein
MSEYRVIHFSSLFAFPKEANTVFIAHARLAAVVLGEVAEVPEREDEPG